MKLIPVIYFLLSSIFCIAQERNDSLRKYSYLISGFKSLNGLFVYHGGTCFFIREKGSLFLITAKHVLSGCREDLSKDINFPHTVYIIGYDDTNKPIQVPLDISVFLDTTVCQFLFIEPDAIAIKMNDEKLNNVHSVEKFIIAPFKRNSSIEIFGYPKSKNISDSIKVVITLSIHPSNLFFADSSFEPCLYGIPDTNNDDNFDLCIKGKSSFEKAVKGYSGSPVFIKDFYSKSWRVAGLFSSMDSVNNVFLFTKIEYALRHTN